MQSNHTDEYQRIQLIVKAGSFCFPRGPHLSSIQQYVCSVYGHLARFSTLFIQCSLWKAIQGIEQNYETHTTHVALIEDEQNSLLY